MKTAATLDGGLLKDAAHMKLDVLFASHLIAEPWRLKTPTTIKNSFIKYGFLIGNFSNNDDSSVKLSEDEEDDPHSLQPMRMQSEATHNVTVLLRFVESLSVDHMLDQHLTRPE